VPAVEAATVLRRDTGHEGDVLAVTGTLGASAGGLRVLQRGLMRPAHAPAGADAPPGATLHSAADLADLQALVEAHRRPVPQLAAGHAFRRAGVRCAMDVSDGLLADLGKLCDASGCGAEVRVDRLPVPAALSRVFGAEALALAAGGGEDYELLCAAPAETMAAARAALAAIGVPCTEIGRLTEGREIRAIDATGRDVHLADAGWDHFGAHDRE
jgi:thiamine-monophosphate kinase